MVISQRVKNPFHDLLDRNIFTFLSSLVGLAIEEEKNMIALGAIVAAGPSPHSLIGHTST